MYVSIYICRTEAHSFTVFVAGFYFIFFNGYYNNLMEDGNLLVMKESLPTQVLRRWSI